MNSRWYSKFLAGFVTSLIIFSLFISPAVAAPGDTVRVSVASNGTQGNNLSDKPSISADGRYVTFDSYASNLVSGDTNGDLDIFVYDRQTGQTTRVSIVSNGAEGNNSSISPSISTDGRYVTFYSYASNLVSGDTNGDPDIFVHDRQTGQTTRVSVASDGTQGNNSSLNPSISADGRYVAFISAATNLVSGDTNGFADVFVRDRQTGQTTRASVASDGTQGSDDSNSVLSISADGRYVTFASSASNLVSGDTNGFADVFVRDRQTGQTTRASVASDGTQGNRESGVPSISADGRYVAFQSIANNLVTGDTNVSADIFVYDRQTGQTTRVSVTSDGSQRNGHSEWPFISVDGRYVTFYSFASLVSGDTNGFADVFVHDRQTGQTTRASITSNGTQVNSGSGGKSSISADGRYVTFPSHASNLVTGDTNGVKDIFVHENDVVPNVEKSNLILVHGMQAFSTSGGYSCSDSIQPYDGTDKSLSTLGDLPDWFLEDHQVWIAHYTTSPLFTAPLELNAKCLRDQLETVAGQSDQPITIVAHSMGGPVSRAAIRYLDTNLQKRIEALYTLGSPHAGVKYTDTIVRSYPALFKCILQPGVCQVSETYMFNFNAMNPNISGVKYTFIGGDATPGILGKLIQGTVGPNDGAVGNYSAVGWVHPTVFFLPWWWVDKSIPGQYWTHEAHSDGLGGNSNTNNYYTKPTNQAHSDAYECIKKLMEGFAPEPQYCLPASLPSQVQSAQATSTSTSSVYTEIQTGHLDAGQSISVPLVVDTNAAGMFYLTGSGGTPTFTLTRPDGQVIDPVYAESHPSEVTYETALGGVATPPYAAYDFTATQLGTWQLNITASDAVDYQAFAALESDRTLTAQTDSSLYQIGDVATITATLTSAGVGLPGTTITATLTRPDEIVDTMNLIDPENDGTYIGAYTIPDAPGHLEIEITASGVDNGTAFTRQENLLVSIAPNDLQLTGTYYDQPRDDNTNGFYDYLDFTAEVNLATPGEYAVSAELYAGNQLITQSGDFFPLVAGTQTVTLPFYGGAIYEAGLDGPYTVKNLYLTPIDIGITVQSVENVWTTAAYSYTQFVDTVSPVVSSVTRTDPNPTSAASVNFAVTFSEIVIGVDASDFTLTTTGVSGATVSGVSGSGSNYIVTVNTGSGNGTIRLDVVDDDTIMDLSGNSLNGGFTTGEEYIVDKPATTVQFSGSTYNVNENGGSATITVNLSSAASQTVSVHYATSDGSATAGTDYSATSGDLIFNPGMTSQTFSVPISNDSLIEGDETLNLTLSSPVNATLGSPNGAVLTIVDNDIAGITVTPILGLVTTEGGGQDTFTVVLDSQPANNVSIGLSSSDTTEGTAFPVSLTFTPANWNTAQTVTVTGMDDSVVDSNVVYTIVTATASSTDPNYNGLDAADVSVTNNDNDTTTNLIFTDGFESGNLSAWSPCVIDSGDLSVSAGAKSIGNYGMQALLDDNVSIYCTSDHPNAETRYLASFDFDPNSIAMVSGDTHTIFGGYMGNSTLVLRVQFRRSSGNYQVQAAILNDGTTWKPSTWLTISDVPHQIKLDWRAASAAGANDGRLKLWIDGGQLADLTAVDNDTRRIDRARLGAVAAIDTGTRGTYFFDEFSSSRGEAEPVVVTADFSGSPTSGSAPLNVFFTNLSQPTASITGYLWDFGDGSTSTEVNPSHTYNADGVYTVSLTAHSASGDDIETKVGYITVSTGTDLIFRDGFETCNLSAWSSSTTDAGDLSAGPPGLVGACSMRVLIDDNISIYVTSDHPNAEPRYRARFYFDPNSIPMVNGDTHTIFGGYAGTSTLVLRMQFRRSSGNYQVQAGLLNDGSTWTNSIWVTISDATHQIEFDWKSATAAGANNGGLTLWIDGTQRANLTGVDNDTRRIDRARLGAVAAIDTGTRGTYYFDEFESSRGGSQATATLTVTKSGNDSGTVTSNPAGINCGSDCSEAYTSGTQVTLTATADSGSTFNGWSGGGCSGTGTCIVNMIADTSVSANFQVDSSDTTNPSVSWIAPVGDGQVYDVGDETIQLEVSATDNVGVSEVIFYRWDYVNLVNVEIGRVSSVPYRINFDASTLLPDFNEINAYAFDAAGNFSSNYIWLNHNTTTDLIFANSFEDDDCFTTQWSACVDGAGDLHFDGPPLVNGQSMRILIDDNNAIHVTSDHPNAEPRYRVRFYFDPNSITMASGNAHHIFYGYNGVSKIVLRVEFRRFSGSYQLRVGILNDASNWTNSAWFTITDAPHPIELDWKAATSAGANNGYLTLWIDGTQKANLTNVDNDTWRIDRVRLGAVAAIDTGTRGTYYFDAFESKRQNYIGP